MKTYNPLDFEEQIYKNWEEKGYFKSENTSDKPPYCIVIPPPNVTGALHMGHALTNAIQDTLIRWRRMQGYNTLWLPGTDHAGIATQAVVERQLRRQGTSRHKIGRKAFLEEVWKWKEQYGKRITNQLRRLGSSLDWSRERFTMDEGLSKAVREVFVKLYEEDLLYRANRLINWCPSCRTALSNLEVEHETHEGNFWHIKYPLLDEKGNTTNEYIIIATTRPETLLGDTAVAVHPNPESELQNKLKKLKSKRKHSSVSEQEEISKEINNLNDILNSDRLEHLKKLSSYIGRKIKLPLTNRQIPIVGDLHADPAFGTGAVKITPAHDFNDFEVGNRHKLEKINILNEDGTLNENAGKKYTGLYVIDAREQVIKDLQNAGLLLKIEPHTHEVGHCSRCNAVVEPMLSLQWFVKTKPLAEEAIKAVKNNETDIIPPMWKKVYFHWMENIEDWCVSRQLWWGHQIPAWYCENGHITVSRSEPTICSKCGSTNIKQDEDVLDTWFSSALWPFSTLGWPENTPELQTFYPNSVMETGFDILFFWVARMMMMGIHFMNEVPFKTVFLHALVRDAQGRKMSKSLGNTIDPLDVINGISLEDLLAKIEAALPPESEKEDRKQVILNDIKKKFPNGIEVHGTDALRFSLAVMAAQGRDVKLDMSRIAGYRAFANKIWQAVSGMVLPNLKKKKFNKLEEQDILNLSLPDKWILSKLSFTIKEVNKQLENFRLNDAADSIYKFIWHEYCDWYLEFSKPVLYGNYGENQLESTLKVMYNVTETFLRLLHPFMPFITEKLWLELTHGNKDESIMISPYPTEKDFKTYEVAERDMDIVQEIIKAVRTIRGENSIAPNLKLEIMIKPDTEELKRIISQNENIIKGNMAKIENISFVNTKPKMCAASPVSGGEIYIPLEGLVDFNEEIARLTKTLKKAEKDLESIRRKLSNEKFLAKAPVHIIEENKRRLASNQDKVDKLSKSLNHFKSMLTE